MKTTYQDWDKFEGNDIPSSLSTYPILYKNIKEGASIVDIGCGFGKTCFELLSKGYHPITGFDINTKGIVFANERLKELPDDVQGKCIFEIRDALNTGYESNSFNIGIMQAFLTTMTTPQNREQAMKEARRIIKKDGQLYLAVFMQTWHSEKYLQKYEKGERETGERGSFYAYNKTTGELEYQAHHYSERELVYLLKNSGFKINSFQYEVFTTRSGKKVNGAVVIAA